MVSWVLPSSMWAHSFMPHLAERPTGNNSSFTSERDNEVWDADSILQRVALHREKHAPNSQTAEPLILKKSLDSKRDHW